MNDGFVALRPPHDGDLDELVAACGDPEIVRFTRVPAPYQRSDAEAFVVEAQERLASGSGWSLVIANPKTDALLGTVLLGIQGPGVAEVGYWVRREDRGRGYATRATRLVSESGIHEFALSRIQLHAFPENVASQRVAEKAGFTREGILRSYREIRGVRRDLVAYSLLASDIE